MLNFFGQSVNQPLLFFHEKISLYSNIRMFRLNCFNTTINSILNSRKRVQENEPNRLYFLPTLEPSTKVKANESGLELWRCLWKLRIWMKCLRVKSTVKVLAMKDGQLNTHDWLHRSIKRQFKEKEMQVNGQEEAMQPRTSLSRRWSRLQRPSPHTERQERITMALYCCFFLKCDLLLNCFLELASFLPNLSTIFWLVIDFFSLSRFVKNFMIGHWNSFSSSCAFHSSICGLHHFEWDFCIFFLIQPLR